jgi:hypothetical protein
LPYGKEANRHADRIEGTHAITLYQSDLRELDEYAFLKTSPFSTVLFIEN